jgi:hypothetical protein
MNETVKKEGYKKPEYPKIVCDVQFRGKNVKFLPNKVFVIIWAILFFTFPVLFGIAKIIPFWIALFWFLLNVCLTQLGFGIHIHVVKSKLDGVFSKMHNELQASDTFHVVIEREELEELQNTHTVTLKDTIQDWGVMLVLNGIDIPNITVSAEKKPK